MDDPALTFPPPLFQPSLTFRRCKPSLTAATSRSLALLSASGWSDGPAPIAPACGLAWPSSTATRQALARAASQDARAKGTHAGGGVPVALGVWGYPAFHAKIVFKKLERFRSFRRFVGFRKISKNSDCIRYAQVCKVRVGIPI
jgi:hypothetical protein